MILAWRDDGWLMVQHEVTQIVLLNTGESSGNEIIFGITLEGLTLAGGEE